LDFSSEVDDKICDKVLAAGGNLTINFYSILLMNFIHSELESSKSQLNCYPFLEYYSGYLVSYKGDCNEFTQEQYNHFVDYFSHLDQDEEPTNELMLHELDTLQHDVSEMILGSITSGKELMERLLIQLLGHENATVRSCSIKYLNCIYDGTIWKLETPIRTEIMVTGEDIKINFTPTVESASYYILLNFPYKGKTAVSYHRIPNDLKVGHQTTLNLGVFEECGFYDYKIVRLRKSSTENIEHHRFIIHNHFVKHANVHEI